MKKIHASKLNDLADELPQIFEWSVEEEDFTGSVLNLSGFGETQKFDPLSVYQVEVPVLRAVEHKQQLKDAYKRGGVDAVRDYVNKVYQKLAQAMN